MSESDSFGELSLLDQIRLVEAEITRRIIAAREASVQRMANARIEAAHIKKQAAEKGTREGQILYKELVARAEEQAHVIISQAHHEADALQRIGQVRMDQAVHQALDTILGMKGYRIPDES